MIWDKTANARLIAIIAGGGNAADVAAEFQVTRVAAQCQISKLRVWTVRNVGEASRDAILRLHDAGWRPSRIGRQTGQPVYIVEAVIVESGSTPHQPPAPARRASISARPRHDPRPPITWTPVLDGLVLRLARAGASADEIGRACGVSEAAAATRLSRLGGRPAEGSTA